MAEGINCGHEEQNHELRPVQPDYYRQTLCQCFKIIVKQDMSLCDVQVDGSEGDLLGRTKLV
jgi:hypothetical protein